VNAETEKLMKLISSLICLIIIKYIIKLHYCKDLLVEYVLRKVLRNETKWKNRKIENHQRNAGPQCWFMEKE